MQQTMGELVLVTLTDTGLDLHFGGCHRPPAAGDKGLPALARQPPVETRWTREEDEEAAETVSGLGRENGYSMIEWVVSCLGMM